MSDTKKYFCPKCGSTKLGVRGEVWLNDPTVGLGVDDTDTAYTVSCHNFSNT